MKKTHFLWIFYFLIFGLKINETCAQKLYTATRIEQAPKIDGFLNESIWLNAPKAEGFTQTQIQTGSPSKQNASVKMVYDDEAIYVAAEMFDTAPDSILKEFTKRDNASGNADIFGVYLDTYNDQFNAFFFAVSASGVQIDRRVYGTTEDASWNAVWYSHVEITETGWQVEMKIPYLALRIPKQDVQNWGVNFYRSLRRYREISYWNTVDPAVAGLVNQFGKVLGISNIKAPLRLSFTPYVSGYTDFYTAAGKTSVTNSFNFGTDLKYGINESFTLDMTLIPDFGQVQSDNIVLNLSPFEVQFNEFRPFFTEGVELFSKMGDLFYSRRVGARPIFYGNVESRIDSTETIKENPSLTQLINATKVSGRTKSGLGIGIFNATTAKSFATIEGPEGNTRQIETSPLTNYNMFVLDQSLKNNSFITLANTNVMRDGATYDANVSALRFVLNNKGNRYSLSGNTSISQFYGRGNPKDELGVLYALRVAKVSGTWQYYATTDGRSEKFDQNDLGFITFNNIVNYETGLSYNIFKPFWKMNNLRSTIFTNYSQLYAPRLFQNFSINGRVTTFITKSFTFLLLETGTEPVTTYDFFEPRKVGRKYNFPTNRWAAFTVSTDYRRKFAIDLDFNYRHFDENERFNFTYNIEPRYRVNNKLFFVFSHENQLRNDDIGFVNNINDDIFFGQREVKTISHILNASYTFTNVMNLSLRLRHYWSNASYKKYHLLEENGNLKEVNYSINHNVTFNAFNIDMFFVWNFTPGSEMVVAWKNSILTSGNQVDADYLTNLNRTFESPMLNSFSIKVLYFIDYNSVKKSLSANKNG